MHPLLPPSGEQPQAASNIIKLSDPAMNPENIKQLIRKTVTPKAVKVRVNEMKILSSNTLNWNAIIAPTTTFWIGINSPWSVPG
ncbi:hypothetical protein C0J52_17870 [Blattella germanica]|nr:hypothetical protein C0J52_17870 [Blattella germanica]